MKATLCLSLLCTTLLLFAGCTDATDTPKAATTEPSSAPIMVADIAAEDVASRLPNVKVLDVRTAEEFAAGHVEGAINIDVKQDNFATLVAELNRDETYLVHCAFNVEAGRSSRAIETMKELGFNNIENLVGGYVAWVDAGGEAVIPESGS